MNKGYAVLAVAVFAIVVGAVWYTRTPELSGTAADETGSAYAYTCDKGMEFMLVPAPDLSSVTLRPVADLSYPPVSVLAESPTDTGRRFRSADFELHARGETVTLYVSASESTYTCAPQPKPNEPPLNWGDGGEGAAAPGAKVTVEARVGTGVEALGETITVREVLEDSRCPADVQCIWAGTVRLAGTAFGGMGLGQLTFELGKTSTTEVNAITLTDVSPAPRSGVDIRESDYVFTLEVVRR